ncbi:MAG: hypothetical protein NC114_01850 [Ruminococcus flavefaciens]|nr:hypothetical protein [Ruminococcus flavefaciens]
MFMIEDDTFRSVEFWDARHLPYFVNKAFSKRDNRKSRYDDARYTDGKTQIEIKYWSMHCYHGTSLIYRDSSSKSWQKW